MQQSPSNPYFAKEVKVERKVDPKAEKLIAIGGKEWIKDDKHRVYFDKKDLLIFFGMTYGSCDDFVKNATLDGEKISNSQATKIADGIGLGNFWYDIKTGSFDHKMSGCQGFKADEIAQRIIKAIEAKIA